MPARPVPPNPKWIAIEANARPFECRGKDCGALVYWSTTQASGKRTPVDVDIEGGYAPGRTTPGLGVMHFQTCPNANDFSKSRARDGARGGRG